MESLSEFLHMGGYAKYVWSAYGIVFAVLIANVIKPWCEHKKLMRGQ